MLSLIKAEQPDGKIKAVPKLNFEDMKQTLYPTVNHNVPHCVSAVNNAYRLLVVSSLAFSLYIKI